MGGKEMRHCCLLMAFMFNGTHNTNHCFYLLMFIRMYLLCFNHDYVCDIIICQLSFVFLVMIVMQ